MNYKVDSQNFILKRIEDGTRIQATNEDIEFFKLLDYFNVEKDEDTNTIVLKYNNIIYIPAISSNEFVILKGDELNAFISIPIIFIDETKSTVISIISPYQNSAKIITGNNFQNSIFF